MMNQKNTLFFALILSAFAPTMQASQKYTDPWAMQEAIAGKPSLVQNLMASWKSMKSAPHKAIRRFEKSEAEKAYGPESSEAKLYWNRAAWDKYYEQHQNDPAYIDEAENRLQAFRKNHGYTTDTPDDPGGYVKPLYWNINMSADRQKELVAENPLSSGDKLALFIRDAELLKKNRPEFYYSQFGGGSKGVLKERYDQARELYDQGNYPGTKPQFESDKDLERNVVKYNWHRNTYPYFHSPWRHVVPQKVYDWVTGTARPTHYDRRNYPE